MTENDTNFLDALLEQKVISDSEKNLRSKVDSIVRSIENLTEKKARLDFEIKKQKKSLTRKREELKRVSNSTQVRERLTLESSSPAGYPDQEDLKVLHKLDQQLLESSFRVIEG